MRALPYETLVCGGCGMQGTTLGMPHTIWCPNTLVARTKEQQRYARRWAW